MSGNCRSCLSMHDGHLLNSILAEWYSTCAGPKMISSSVLPPNAWEKVAAILFFEPIGDGLGYTHRPLGRLRMLRAPMDFAMGGSTPAIYGTVDPALAITRYTEWRPDKMFKSNPLCQTPLLFNDKRVAGDRWRLEPHGSQRNPSRRHLQGIMHPHV